MSLRDVLVEDARQRMLDLAVKLPSEDVALADALGRILARDVSATRDQPPFTASAMDGWAIRSADTGPRRQVGESAAGRGYDGQVGQGEAVRIFTGAPVPAGADAVIIQENVGRDGETLILKTTPKPRDNIRGAGGDFHAGDRLLGAGAKLDPWRLSLAAAAGKAVLAVARKPRVAILSTGDEIVLPGGNPGPHQIFNSGSPALAAMVERWGGEGIVLNPAADTEEAILEAVADAGYNVLVTVGGASVGDHDLVKPTLAKLGLSLAFESLKMRPGKPTSFGTLTDGRRVLGLPGNPASAMACAELFLKPLLMAMQGADPAVRLVQAKLTVGMEANSPREHWMRARLSNVGGNLMATPFGNQDSSLVAVFAQADALLRRLPDARPAKAGEVVEVLVLDRF